MTQRRNLETWEIIDQFLQAREIVKGEGRRVTGAVFMGMGEPFLNYDRVMAAADLLALSLRWGGRGSVDHHQHGRSRAGNRSLHRGTASISAGDQPRSCD